MVSIALGSVLLASGCSAPPVPTRSPLSTATIAPTPSAIPPPAVMALAQSFANQFVSREYELQWAELSLATQAMWPSEAARANMLSAKFGRLVTAVGLGAPSLESTWTEPEDPAMRFADVWTVPARVQFTSPQSLRPAGVASLFSMTPIQIEVQPSGGLAIVGEGPASMDAPIILPTAIRAVSVVVPILMYHLVDQVPPRSIEPSTYGWKLEIGLTTLPGEFADQMAYLTSIHATSISLQHLADALLYALPLPPHAFVITFDDGRLSPWYNAVPLLQRDGYTAVFFPCTGLIGGRVGPQTYLSADEIRQLAAGGFWVEDHTFNDAQALFGANSGTLNALTNRTKTTLQAITGTPVQFLAYSGLWPWPLATQGGAREASVFATLAGYGYIGGVLDVRVGSETESSAQLWQLPRLRVGIDTTLAGFARWFANQRM